MTPKQSIRTYIIIAVGLSIASNCVHASPNDPNTPKDPNVHHFVWVVALEKDFPEQSSEQWSPTLYRINVEQAKVVDKKKLAEQGAPIFCYSLPDSRLKIVLCIGVAANGTCAGEPTTTTLTVDKNSLKVLDGKTKQGYDNPQQYRNIVSLDKNRKLVTAKLKEFVNKGERFVGLSKISPRIFTLKRSLQDDPNSTVQILDLNSLRTIESIPMKTGNLRLGSFAGTEYGDAELISNRYLICLFSGVSSLGRFAPAYLLIIDTELKTPKYVKIGSNPSNGIAF